MPRFRFVIDDPTRVYEALVAAVDAVRGAEVVGDIGPWDDAELRADHTIEVVGSDEFTTLVAEKLITEDIGFEVGD